MVSALYDIGVWEIMRESASISQTFGIVPLKLQRRPIPSGECTMKTKKSAFPHWWAAQRTLKGTTRPASSSRNVVLAWASTNGIQFQRLCVKEGSSVSIEHCQTEDSSNPPVQDTSEWKESETTKAPWQNRRSTNSQDDRTFHSDLSPVAFVVVPLL